MTGTVEVAAARLRKVSGEAWETLDARMIVRRVRGPGTKGYCAGKAWWTVHDRYGGFGDRSVVGRHRAQQDIAEFLRGETGMGS